MSLYLLASTFTLNYSMNYTNSVGKMKQQKNSVSLKRARLFSGNKALVSTVTAFGTDGKLCAMADGVNTNPTSERSQQPLSQ